MGGLGIEGSPYDIMTWVEYAYLHSSPVLVRCHERAEVAGVCDPVMQVPAHGNVMVQHMNGVDALRPPIFD